MKVFTLLIALTLGFLTTSCNNFTFHKKKAFIFDAMMDLDDLYSLYLISRSKKANLLGVTVSGTRNYHYANAAENAASVLYLAHKTSIPVSKQLSPSFCQGHISSKNYFQKVSEEIRSYDLPPSPVLPLDETAIDLTRKIANSTEKKLTLLSVGGVTNVAHAITEHPSIKEKIERIIILGGSLHTTESITIPERSLWRFSAEYTINIDPCAANIVLTSGIPITVIPLDVTNLVPLNQLVLEKYAHPPKNAGTNFIMKVLQSGLEPNKLKASTPFWNMIAFMCLVDPKVVTLSKLPLKIITDPGNNFGSLITSDTGTMVDVCTDINPKLFYERFFSMINSDE